MNQPEGIRKGKKVTVIVPCYNVENYVLALMQSLDEQTYEDFEAIFIDDGSTDRTVSVILDYCNDPAHALSRRFRLLRQTNAGVGAARNRGLDEADGDFIFFVDGDDHLYPQTLSSLAALMKEGADLAVGAYEAQDGSVVSYPHIDDRDAWLRATIAHGALTLWNKMYLRSIIENFHIRFDTQTRKSEDHLFTANYLVSTTGRILTTDSIVYFYAWNPLSISHISMTTKTFSPWIADSVYVAARIYRLMEDSIDAPTRRELRYDCYHKYRRIRHEAHQHRCKDKDFYEGMRLEMRSIMPAWEMALFALRRRLSIYVQSVRRKLRRMIKGGGR